MKRYEREETCKGSVEVEEVGNKLEAISSSLAVSDDDEASSLSVLLILFLLGIICG